MSMEQLFFFFIAGLATISAILMVTRPNPVMSVLFLIVNFFCLAVLYLFLQAQFIAVIQILVYAGAIMVLFLFVIMLLNVGEEKHLSEKHGYRRMLGILLAGVVLVEIFLGIGISFVNGPTELPIASARIGTVEQIGKSLFSTYLLPFEITSILLLAAMVGVLVLAKKKFE